MNKMMCASLMGLSVVGVSCADDINKKGKDVTLKIRFVNSMELMRDTQEGQKISQELQAKYKGLAEEIQEQNKKLETAAADFKKKESILSDTAKEAEQKKIMKMKRDLEVKAQEAEEEYKIAAQKATEKISKEIIDVVEEIAKAEGLDAIIDKDSGRALYVANSANNTSKVKEGMNKKFSAKKTSTGKTA